MPRIKKSVLPATPLPTEGAKLYHFKSKPARILSLFKLFDELEERMKSKRRFLGWVLFFLWIGFFLAFFVAKSVLPTGFENGCILHCLICLWFLGVTFNLRTALMRRRSGKILPGISTSGWVAIVAALFMSIPIATLVLDSLASVKGHSSLQQNPNVAFSCFLFSVTFCALILLTLHRRRLKFISPQAFEIDFCGQIVKTLLPELAPSAIVNLSFNPFPAEWSMWAMKRPHGGKTLFFDTLLDLRLDLGSARNLSIRVMHRRTSKGRRKHKGWKHKIKCKYVLSGDVPLQGSDAAARQGFIHFRKQTSSEIPKPENPLKFQSRLDASSTDFSSFDKSMFVVQTFLTPCKFSDRLDAGDLPHPKFVLEAVKALVSSYEISRPSPSTGA